ncbi:DUF4030 domain-containing protein [Sporolactobacillus shoreicorticis]|uniref:DUF4030 domain-containing protein n=1 Tax=Sporolactobacillus shoreicorticis TaxID=1923877 RepID=A0ABW5S8S0_9BACL|nr:DUF4030 domain-containing protein [Sporolactobacillus shoreicorticis]MCO7126912.1 DUF4030 domain-containing protein [Sporolactobacillus shoreicorticis]
MNQLRDDMIDMDIPDELHQRVVAGVEQAMHDGKPAKSRKWGIKKKGVAVAAAVLFAFCLLVDSPFVSPAMANVAQKIPFLNAIYHKDISTRVAEALDAKHIPYDGISILFGKDKKIVVSIKDGTDPELRQEAADVLKRVVIKENDFDAFSIQTVDSTEDSKPIKEKPEEEKRTKVLSELGVSLKGFPDVIVGIRIKAFDVQIPDTEKRVGEIKQKIKEVVNRYHMDDDPIKITTYSMAKRRLDDQWYPLITTIGEGFLAKKEYHVKGFGYSIKENTMNFIITTTYDQVNEESKKTAAKIEQLINSFLKSEDAQKRIGGKKYKIIINSKDHQRIN